jgi:hypothetical protein
MFKIYLEVGGEEVLVQSVKTNSRQPLNDVTARLNARTGYGMS